MDINNIWASVRSISLVQASLFTLLIPAILVGRVLLRALFSPLRNVPGPFAARFTRLWELRALNQGNFPRTHVELHEKYGPVVRLAPNRYSVADPEAYKIIYGHGSKFEKSAFYHAFGNPDYDKSDLFSERNSQRHAAKRRMVASLYSMTSLVSYEKFVDTCTAVLSGKLRAFAREGRVIDLPQWMQFYAFDVIGEISVGKAFGFMESEFDERGILGAIDETMVYGSRIGLFPELHPWLALMVSTLGMKIPFDSVAEFINEQIGVRRSGKEVGVKNDFLAKLLEMQANEKIDQLNLFTTLGANIAAGSDTTGISLSTVFYCLIKNPQVLQKMRQEITEFESEGKISDPITFQESQKMPYLQAVIKESLRCHPATGQILARTVPSEGVVISGHFFPEGSVVGASAWVTHQNKEIFGRDASLFRPERWLEDKAQAVKMDTNMFSFGAGSRTCIGRNITMLEMMKVIPQIVRQFDFELEDPSGEWELVSGWFVKQKYRCRVSGRSDK